MNTRQCREHPPTLQELQDRAQIACVLARYSRGVDRKDEALLRSVYHDDATDQHGSFNGSAADFVTQLMPRLRDMSVCFHGLCNPWIEISGDVAVAETYYVGFIRMPIEPGALPQDIQQFGRYVDRLERRAGVWKIAHRQLLVDDTIIQESSGRELPPAFRRYMAATAAPEDFVYRRWSELQVARELGTEHEGS